MEHWAKMDSESKTNNLYFITLISLAKHNPTRGNIFSAFSLIGLEFKTVYTRLTRFPKSWVICG